MKNIELIGYTKINLSPIYRIGLADYGDYRSCIKLVVSWSTGDFYRPFYGDDYFTKETLPDSAKWVLRGLELSNRANEIVSKINSEFSTQSRSLASYIHTYFNYKTNVERTQIHHIEFPCEWSSCEYSMRRCVMLAKEVEAKSKALKIATERIVDLRKMYDKLALCTFNRFFIGRIGKTSKTRSNQLIKFIQLLTN